MGEVVGGVCGFDAEGNTTFCNDALAEMTGYRKEEIIGRNVHQLLHHSRPDGTGFRDAFDAPQAVHGADVISGPEE